MTDVTTHDSTADCRGKTAISDHHMEIVGNCTHHPKGSIRDYEASRCRDCGVTAHRTRMFACGPKIKAVAATPETCAALAAARPPAPIEPATTPHQEVTADTTTTDPAAPKQGEAGATISDFCSWPTHTHEGICTSGVLSAGRPGSERDENRHTESRRASDTTTDNEKADR